MSIQFDRCTSARDAASAASQIRIMDPPFPSAFSFDGENAVFDAIPTYTWKNTIRIREYNTILTMYGTPGEPFKPSVQIGKRTLPLIKSNLQKCIRRKDEGRAIRTALAMYSLNPNEVLRRLPIIMIEDCLPYPKAFVKLIWFMCAVSKGYVMSTTEVESMLGIVATMCDSSEYEVAARGRKTIGPSDWVGAPNEDFFWAMELRKIYGGLPCDKEMIGFHQELWLDRFKGSEWPRLVQTDYEVDIDSVDDIGKGDILLESIDQHPYPFIVGKILDKVPDLSADEIRMAIWMCRSKINVRTPLNSDTFVEASAQSKKAYLRIDKELTGLTAWLLGKICLKD